MAAIEMCPSDLLSRQCIVGELGLADGFHFLHLLVSQKSKKLCFFSSSHVWMWVGPQRWLSAKELMLLNWGVGEDSWESLGLKKRSSQSILKVPNPGYSLEGLMLKLKLQYFGHLKGRAGSLEKTLILGKIEGRRRRGQQEMRWLDGILDSMDMS